MATIKETIMDLFELDKMPEAEADKLLNQITGMVMQSVLIRVLPTLSEEDTLEYDKIMNASTDGLEVIAFLNKKIPNFGVIIEEEVAQLKKDLSQEFEKYGV